LRESKAEMVVVVLLVLALIVITLVLQFRSVVKAAVVMLTVPLVLIASVIGLFVTVLSLRVHGHAGGDQPDWRARVQHDRAQRTNRAHARVGSAVGEALVKAGLSRLRPVLMTVLAVSGGLTPLFFGGGALWHPLTAVHIFGLLFAPVLTLVMLPTMYYVFCAKLKLIK
jgi:multidrug efflux pump subunit AcrB